MTAAFGKLAVLRSSNDISMAAAYGKVLPLGNSFQIARACQEVGPLQNGIPFPNLVALVHINILFPASKQSQHLLSPDFCCRVRKYY